MTRVIGVIVHNWPLKLAAVGLATLLYGGLVLSQSSATLTGVVPVEVREPATPTRSCSSPIRPVTEIRYFAPSNVRPIESDFEALDRPERRRSRAVARRACRSTSARSTRGSGSSGSSRRT